MIAQNGANQASATHTESRLEALGTAVTVTGVIVGVMLLVLLYKLCANRTRRLLRKELGLANSASVQSVHGLQCGAQRNQMV